jgi:plasmid replication initiation protein
MEKKKQDKKQVAIKDLAVTQSNTLVEAIYPRYVQNRDGVEVEIDGKATTRAHKISRLIISLISPDDEDLRLYRISIATLKEYLGYKPDFPNGKFYQDLRDIAVRLNQQPIEIRPEPKRHITAFFISSYELNYKTGEAIFEISAQLKPFLLQLKNNFTSLHLHNIPKLSSGYAIRLYELLFQYKTIGKRSFDDIDRLQRMIGSSYDKYSHFKARVLEPSKKDIAENTDIRFDYEEIKTGKKVTKLVFHIKTNIPQAEYEEVPLTIAYGQNTERGIKADFDNSLVVILNNLGIQTNRITDYVNMGFDIIKDDHKRAAAMRRCGTITAYYQEKIALLNTSKSDNPAGFIIKALQEDWINTKLSQEADKQKKQKDTRDRNNRIKELEKQIERTKKTYNDSLKPIYAKLAANDTVFMLAYEAVLSGFAETAFFRSTLRAYKTPQEAYQNMGSLHSMINAHFLKNYASEFEHTEGGRLMLIKLENELRSLQK